MVYKTKNEVIVEAVKWVGDNQEDIKKFLLGCIYRIEEELSLVVFQTPKALYRISLHDWILKDSHGNFYACRSAVFDLVFESVV